MARRYPLHIHISTLFVILILLVGGLIGGLGYQHSRKLLETSANDQTLRISRETASEFNRLLGPAEMAVDLLGLSALTRATTLSERLQFRAPLREALKHSPALTALYIGYANGDFFLMRRLNDAAEAAHFKAPSGCVYLIQSIERGNGHPLGRYLYLDAELQVLRDEERPEYPGSYDPRQRDWYRAAQAGSGQIKTPPYVFYANRRIGTTLAVRTAQGNGVVGADILLETLGHSLAQQKVTPTTEIALANADGRAIAYPDLARLVLPGEEGGRPTLARLEQLGAPAFTALMQRWKKGEPQAEQFSLVVNGDNWRINLTPIPLRGAPPFLLVTAVPDSELLALAQQMVRNSALATILIILLAIPVTWLLARSISRSMQALASEAESIRHFDFSRPIATRSPIKEVDELAATMDSMKSTIRRFLDISLAVAAEEDFDHLLARLLDETLRAASADTGVLYLADQGRLLPTQTRRNGNALAGHWGALSLDESTGLLGKALRSTCAQGGVMATTEIAQLGLEALAEPGEDGHVHAIVVPLLNRQRQCVGVLLLICRQPPDPALVSFVGALSGSATVSLEARELIKAQKELFEAFIRLIAGAIDSKSAHTGGHCARVPELAKMLAHAACADRNGPFKNFSLDTNGWEALHIAAWLHDCGKITTPDYVVDKATKLETLYDRIHEVRMRFEVLKRDAEIACLKSVAAGTDAALAGKQLAEEWRQLDDDFAFVATCNEGGEFMAPDKIARLQAIARRTWQRTLDDRLGIAHEEKARRNGPPAALPATEPLLADKPEHRIERRPQDRLTPDNPWGFRMAVPELLYDRGELHNLGVSRGTLTDEERYKINEHIVQTVIMLAQLPFPKHLREVPELAGGHHEKMDGTGYPRRLKREEMSLAARMMAIADIFEALTAIDRPYKKGKALSESIAIMARMQAEGHIDPDLFALFLRSGVYRDYAERFMRPEQIDAVEIADYLPE